MRNELLFTLSLVSTACVQDVDLSLGTPDAGGADATAIPDSGVALTCTGSEVECTLGCQTGRAPRPDLTCGGSDMCCSTVATTCSSVAPQCEHCGALYPPTCVGTNWMCEAPQASCPYCNADSECSANTYCDNDFASRTGNCLACPAGDGDVPLACPEAIRTDLYGNGCAFSTCECGADNAHAPPECTGDTGWLELDPASLTFYALPIDSIRFAISGRDPDAGQCVTMVWIPSSIGSGTQCPTIGSDLYVIVSPDTGAGCENWDYAPNVTLESVVGCFDFRELETIDGYPHLDLADIDLQVSGAAFTGGIRIKNRTSLQPWPVTFELQYVTDVPDDGIWIQEHGATPRAAWVKLFADGAELPIGAGCDLEVCETPRLNCPSGLRPSATNLGGNQAVSSAVLTWDGMVYVVPTDRVCLEPQPSHPRDYEAEFCWGTEANDTGIIINEQCQRVPFTYPVSRVTAVVGGGG